MICNDFQRQGDNIKIFFFFQLNKGFLCPWDPLVKDNECLHANGYEARTIISITFKEYLWVIKKKLGKGTT